MTKVGIIQPNYIPWRGYFDFIHEVDVFVFLDDVKFTKRDWRNRNRLQVLNGKPVWLSVPVTANSLTLIKDTEISYDISWVKDHLGTMRANYSKQIGFDPLFDELSEVYNQNFRLLADLDIALIDLLCKRLGITTKMLRSSELGCQGRKDHRLIEITRKLGGTGYLSGPAAKSYLQPQLWQDAGIELRFKTYDTYPKYPQNTEQFDPHLSVLDLMFCTGPTAPDHIWGAR